MTETRSQGRHLVVDSRAQRVTFFEDRAEVSRVARCTVPAGVTWVAVQGVTAMVDDSSLIAGIPGDQARVIAARVVRRVRHVPAAHREELQATEADLVACRQRGERAGRAVARTLSQEQRGVVLLESWTEAVARVPAGLADGRASWVDAERVLDRSLVQALDASSAQRTELERTRLDLARAELRHAQARELHPQFETHVEVQVEARVAGEVQLDLTYRTPCALWRPEHLARVRPRADGAGDELVLKTWATVWQHTGEEWTDVACRCSTARPAQTASPPLVTDDLLGTRKKTEAERRTVVVEARDQAIAVAGLGRGARAVDEMPGVEDGGEPQVYEATRPATIPGDGQPFRVEIGELVLPCTVDRVAYPESGGAAHVRATATLAGAGPLLAGPVRLARGSELVGRGRIAYVGRGEPFELGFGVDDGLRVRRHVDEKRETTPVIGTQKLTRTVRLYVSNLSGVAKKLRVTERVPVSEIRDVEVAVTSGLGARFDERDGFAHFDLEVEARGTRELELAWRLEAGSKVVLPF